MQHSLSAQISYYSALIQKTPEWEYAGVYADYGISGTGMRDRDEFNRMLADCEAGRIDIILTKSIQRFARNTVDLLNTVRHLKELGIEVRFEKENINSMSGDGELMLQKTPNGASGRDSSQARLALRTSISLVTATTMICSNTSSSLRRQSSSAGCSSSTFKGNPCKPSATI